MGKGSGGGGTSTTISDLPDYLKPYAERSLARAESESQRPYEPYGAQRIAGTQGDTQDAYQGIRDLSQSGLGGLSSAASLWGDSGQKAGQFANYQAGNVNTSFNPNAINSANVNAGQWDQNAANQYMNPYINNVVERQKQGAILDWERTNAARGGDAINAGMFGGSRHGVADYLSQEGLNRGLQDIEASGLNQAWNQGQGMFSSDRDAAAQTGLANVGNWLTAQQGTEAGRQYGADYQQQGEALNEQMSQSGAKIGLAGLDAQQEAASGLQRTQQQYDDMIMGRTNALATIGDKQQQQEQMSYDLAYSDFQNQRDQERQNLQFLNSIMAGVPVSGQGNVTQYKPQDSMSNLIGLGISGLGAYKEYKGSA